MIPVRQEQAKHRFDERCLLGKEFRLLHAVRHQRVLDAIHWRDLGRERVYPIDGLALLGVLERGLMLGAKQGAQIDVPIALVLFPPIKIDVEGGIDCRLYEAKTLCFRHGLLHFAQTEI